MGHRWRNRATSKHMGEEAGIISYSSHGWVGQGFSLTVTLQPAEASLPGLDVLASVYFSHLSQSLTGEVYWLLLLQVFHEEVLYGCRRVVGFGVSIATAGEGVQV